MYLVLEILRQQSAPEYHIQELFMCIFDAL